MDKKVQIAASGIIGISVGLFGGYILAEQRLKTMYQRHADQEISVMRERFHNQQSDIEDKVEDKKRELQETQDYIADVANLVRRKYGVEDVYAELRELPEEEEEGLRAFYPEEELEEVVEDYIPTEVVKEEEEMYETDDELSEIGHVDQDQREPYFIDEEVFSLNERNYTHSMLTYFIEDGIIIDDTDQVVEDEFPLVGDKLKELDGKDHIDLAYIRNNRIMLELEIVIERDSFADFAYSVGLR